MEEEYVNELVSQGVINPRKVPKFTIIHEQDKSRKHNHSAFYIYIIFKKYFFNSMAKTLV